MTVARHDEELWKVDPENCCSAVKVGQLDRALLGKAAWMSGLRRAEADTRVKAPIVARDLRGLDQGQPASPRGPTRTCAGYIADHDVPVNPLLDQGYLSIGCMPCTSAGRRRRRSPLGPLGRPRQDRVRPAPLLMASVAPLRLARFARCFDSAPRLI